VGRPKRAPAECPHCERFVRVMQDGRFELHRLDDWSFCPGSGQSAELPQPTLPGVAQ
jgi:hypothetical protein